MLAWAALYLALRYSYEVKASERRARIVENLAHAAQLRALQNQISPHFMFNTLNSISALMLDNEVKRAEAMLRGLSDFLRATLALDPVSDISLSEELRIQRMYLDIEQARFPDMGITVRCPPELEGARVPALITQPIVENAVKYGVARSLRPTSIEIAAARTGDRLLLTIVDDGRAESQAQAGLGVGLRNVVDRLRNRFGAMHSFTAGPLPQGGFEVRLALPLVVARR
jgi:LytS/YehU family sensor histidine kinase